MKNVLITTLGTSWQIVPELYGFTNPGQLDLYCQKSSYQADQTLRTDNAIEPVDAIWIITTEKMILDSLQDWAKDMAVPLRFFWPRGVDELSSVEENIRMADLIYRAVLHGHAATKGGKLYLSLAGGRKTMSAEMQQAGMLFGCSALLHVVDRKPSTEQQQVLKEVTFTKPLPAAVAEVYQPLVLMTDCPANACLSVDPPVTAGDYPLTGGEVVVSPDLYQDIRNRLKQAENLLYNFSLQISENDLQTNFHGLYTLPPERIRQLTQERIAARPMNHQADVEWLQQLPKADLHCHLGGILDACGLIEVALTLAGRVEEEALKDQGFSRRLERLRELVQNGNAAGIRAFLGEDASGSTGLFKVTRSWHKKEPLGVCGFLLCFVDHPAFLDELIFDNYRQAENFQGIGIENYEPLGDLQGSGLLQCRETLHAACRILRRQVAQQQIRYLELRCSPHNYTRGGLSAREVVEILLAELDQDTCCTFRLLFIASRHRVLSEAYRHIELAEELLQESEAFRRLFVGFDLAGNEQSRSPRTMRDAFMPLLNRCIPVTIHAGEGEPVDNIWEAVYELNADRVGHGLTLGDSSTLLRRFVERRIAIEMCPSSNTQVVGYRDWMKEIPGKTYPLRSYLDLGLRVTVNTDNPGISRTSLADELYRAAAMSEGGLTRWQILQLLRNSLQAAFCPLEQRRELLRQAEQLIVNQLTDFARKRRYHA